MSTDAMPDRPQHKILVFSTRKYVLCYRFFLVASYIAHVLGILILGVAFSLVFVTQYNSPTITVLVSFSACLFVLTFLSMYVWGRYPPVRLAAPRESQSPSLPVHASHSIFDRKVRDPYFVPNQPIRTANAAYAENQYALSYPSALPAQLSDEVGRENTPRMTMEVGRQTEDVVYPRDYPVLNYPPPVRIPSSSEMDEEHISPMTIDMERQISEPKQFKSKYRYTPTFGAYVFPREGGLERCQDKIAYHQQKARYAVADGVGTSFLPGRWAEIIAEGFVADDCNFDNPQEIMAWLRHCSQVWHQWVDEVWVPSAYQNSGQGDWSREIENGAATTLAGCSFSPSELAQKRTAKVQVVVVGDAEFFLLTREALGTQLRWQCQLAWHLQLEEFGHATKALATPERRVMRDHRWVNVTNVDVQLGDCLVLATDALAKWILRAMERGQDVWNELFALRDQESFRRFVLAHRKDESLELDDTTLMIIPIEIYS